MIFFIIVFIVIVIFIGISCGTNNSDESSLDDIAKTEMMSDIYKDITGDNLDTIEKSILFMHNQKNKRN